jgi:Zn-finger nucleic acid-binding protein
MARRPPSDPAIKPLLSCPKCRIEMRLFGIEPENEFRDLYTFECPKCRGLEVRGVLLAVPPR